MADTDIIVSEMTPASQINTTDLMIMTQPDAQAETGYTTKSGTVLQVANKMLKGTEYSTDLPDFTDKTPLGGLEELKADIKALLPIGSASGNPCTFETNLADTLVSLTANITASGGNGTPATPIPIVGHSELNLANVDDTTAQLWVIDSSFDGTVAWNQLVKNGNFVNANNWNIGTGDTLTISNNKATYKATAQYHNLSQWLEGIAVKNHRYIVSFVAKSYGINTRAYFRRVTNGQPYDVKYADLSTTESRQFIFNTFNDDGNAQLIFQDNNTSDFGNIEVSNAMIFDLTVMFGSTIADYIYSLEQNNAGDGVAFFRYFYPEDYYSYNAGETQTLVPMPYTVSFGQTVYSGVYDANRGKVTDNTKKFTYTDIINNYSSYDATLNRYRADMKTTNNSIDGGDGSIVNPSNAKCNIADCSLTWNQMAQNVAYPNKVGVYKNDAWNYTRVYIYIDDNSVTTREQAETWLTSHNFELVYELATPIEIDVSELSVSAIVGTNNITSDGGGDVEVQYRDSIQHYIDKKIAETQALIL